MEFDRPIISTESKSPIQKSNTESSIQTSRSSHSVQMSSVEHSNLSSENEDAVSTSSGLHPVQTSEEVCSVQRSDVQETIQKSQNEQQIQSSGKDYLLQEPNEHIFNTTSPVDLGKKTNEEPDRECTDQSIEVGHTTITSTSNVVSPVQTSDLQKAIQTTRFDHNVQSSNEKHLLSNSDELNISSTSSVKLKKKVKKNSEIEQPVQTSLTSNVIEHPILIRNTDIVELHPDLTSNLVHPVEVLGDQKLIQTSRVEHPVHPSYKEHPLQKQNKLNMSSANPVESRKRKRKKSDIEHPTQTSVDVEHSSLAIHPVLTSDVVSPSQISQVENPVQTSSGKELEHQNTDELNMSSPSSPVELRKRRKKQSDIEQSTDDVQLKGHASNLIENPVGVTDEEHQQPIRKTLQQKTVVEKPPRKLFILF